VLDTVHIEGVVVVNATARVEEAATFEYDLVSPTVPVAVVAK
jgi:hypothetical protein